MVKNAKSRARVVDGGMDGRRLMAGMSLKRLAHRQQAPSDWPHHVTSASC